MASKYKGRRLTCLLLASCAAPTGRESLVLGALSIIASTPVLLCWCWGTNIAVLLDCSKSSRQCSLPYLLYFTYLQRKRSYSQRLTEEPLRKFSSPRGSLRVFTVTGRTYADSKVHTRTPRLPLIPLASIDAWVHSTQTRPSAARKRRSPTGGLSLNRPVSKWKRWQFSSPQIQRAVARGHDRLRWLTSSVP